MAGTNLERYKKDLDELIATGELLLIAIKSECFPAAVADQLKKKYGEKADLVLKKLPDFGSGYQAWYSEAKAIVRQLLPDRLGDFVRLYEKPKPRKEISYENYRIEDYFQGLTITSGWEKKKVAGPDAAIPHFRQQLAILSAAKIRFESSLFDIRQLVQADLLDSELDAAKELAKNGYARAAGAVAGVVLEHHLAQVAENHSISSKKKNPTIADFNDALKASQAIETSEWRFIQHLGDLRNLCDHKKSADPTKEQISDLIEGVAKITKTLF
jgi:hypothetical protein